jgi:hypothetical protein
MTDTQFAELRRLQQLETNVTELTKNLRSGACRDCSATIFWLEHRTGTRTPYNADLSNHVKTCVKGEQYRRDQFNNRAKPEALPA